MTQLHSARIGEITKEMEKVASQENMKKEYLRRSIEEGRIVIPVSKEHRNLNPIGIGAGLRTKVNANIGSSPNKSDFKDELGKLKIAVKYGADTVMDLGTGGNIDEIRRDIIKNSSVPIGTVPIYQAVVEKGSIVDLSEKDFMHGIKKHIEDGVDFITVHCGLLREAVPLVKKRLGGVVSRGGSFLVKWMEHNKRENPLFENFDKILHLANKYDVTLSLGDGLRPGCLKDATDRAQLSELKVLGDLTKKAWKEDVQVMVEGPGHVPLDQIEHNIKLQKDICHGAPFYVLGPLVTDVAPGYDHITSAIGGTLAAFYGANFLCYVTGSEHLGLPTIQEVKEGVISARIAAHAADIAKGVKGARDWDDNISEARKKLDWDKMMELSIDREKAEEIRNRCKPDDPEVCSMCGKFCSVKIGNGLK